MNLDAGGAQTFLASLAIEQKKLGHDVSIIVIDEPDHSDFQNLLINSLNESGVDLHFLNRKISQNLSFLNTFKGIIDRLDSVDPNVINTHISTSHLLTNLCLRFSHIN